MQLVRQIRWVSTRSFLEQSGALHPSKLNGMTLKEAREIFSSTPGLTCERVIITPLIAPKLSRREMQAALGSSKTLGLIAFSVADSLGAEVCCCLPSSEGAK